MGHRVLALNQSIAVLPAPSTLTLELGLYYGAPVSATDFSMQLAQPPGLNESFPSLVDTAD